MRILQVGPLPPEQGGLTAGGVATHVWGLAQQVAAAGHQTAILAENADPQRTEASRNGQIKIFAARPLSVRRAGRYLQPRLWRPTLLARRHLGAGQNWLGVAGRLSLYSETIEAFRPDVIHVHHLEDRFPFAHYAPGCETPTVATVHSTHSLELDDRAICARNRGIIERNLPLVHRVVFVSEYVRQRYRELFPDSMARVQSEVIYNAVESAEYYPLPRDEARAKLGIKDSEPLVLYVGNLIPRKQVDLLLAAAAQLQREGVRFSLRLVGDGPLRAELTAQVDAHDLGRRVHFEGSRRYPDLLHYYNAADVLVLPSRSEGFPISVLEALACGCPIVGTSAALREAIPSDATGYRCEPTPEDLATTLKQSLARSWDREQIAGHGASYTWPHLLPSFERLYEKAPVYAAS